MASITIHGESLPSGDVALEWTNILLNPSSHPYQQALINVMPADSRKAAQQILLTPSQFFYDLSYNVTGLAKGVNYAFTLQFNSTGGNVLSNSITVKSVGAPSLPNMISCVVSKNPNGKIYSPYTTTVNFGCTETGDGLNLKSAAATLIATNETSNYSYVLASKNLPQNPKNLSGLYNFQFDRDALLAATSDPEPNPTNTLHDIYVPGFTYDICITVTNNSNLTSQLSFPILDVELSNAPAAPANVALALGDGTPKGNRKLYATWSASPDSLVDNYVASFYRVVGTGSVYLGQVVLPINPPVPGVTPVLEAYWPIVDNGSYFVNVRATNAEGSAAADSDTLEVIQVPDFTYTYTFTRPGPTESWFNIDITFFTPSFLDLASVLDLRKVAHMYDANKVEITSNLKEFVELSIIGTTVSFRATEFKAAVNDNNYNVAYFAVEMISEGTGTETFFKPSPQWSGYRSMSAYIVPAGAPVIAEWAVYPSLNSGVATYSFNYSIAAVPAFGSGDLSAYIVYTTESGSIVSVANGSDNNGVVAQSTPTVSVNNTKTINALNIVQATLIVQDNSSPPLFSSVHF